MSYQTFHYATAALSQPLNAAAHACHASWCALVRSKIHGALMAERLAALDPAVAARFAQGGANLAHLLADPLALLHQGAAAMLAHTSAHLLVTLTAVLLTGWRAAQVNPPLFTSAGEFQFP